jgi:hypothetical protein
MPKNNSEEKPVRLYFKSYLIVVRNAVGSRMFNNFYVKTPSRGEFDAFNNGEYSCAFFVSTVLLIFKKIEDFHGTVENLVAALKKASWQKVGELQPGDVIIWEPINFPEGQILHTGFALGDGRAVSTSWKQKCVIEHDINFGERNRKIEAIYRYSNWENR